MLAPRESAPPLADFRDLRVWQVGMDLVIESYRLGDLLPARERFGLVAQIRRAATSVPSNVAEGNGRVHRREYLHHLSIARGSLNELQTLIAIADRLGYLPAAELARFAELCDFAS
ncbi:MAG: four helix bundle protein, partial [Gemmatimonadota bacterium]|nr:four helix bundle protein [Gemmatimonadota bacterium]